MSNVKSKANEKLNQIAKLTRALSASFKIFTKHFGKVITFRACTKTYKRKKHFFFLNTLTNSLAKLYIVYIRGYAVIKKNSTSETQNKTNYLPEYKSFL